MLKTLAKAFLTITLGLVVLCGLLFLVAQLREPQGAYVSSSFGGATRTPTLSASSCWATAPHVTYEQIARSTESYIGRPVQFSGRAVQVIESGRNYDLRVAWGRDMGDIVYVRWAGERVLESDNVRVCGTVLGRITYTTVLGAQVTVPEVRAQYLTTSR